MPHAGRIYPDGFVASSRLNAASLRRSEDAFVDRLFAGVVAMGAPLMAACFPRAYLDLNREPFELDPRMFEGRLPPYANTRSMRVAGGLGTVPRVVADGQDIYRSRLPVGEAVRRIEQLYQPYHRALRDLLRGAADAFGHVALIDCHSMPSTSLGRDEKGRADIVLGDRYGTSCATLLTDVVESTFRDLGFDVTRNKPYAGGFITEHYGAPALGRHALQIEINRGLYMDEATLTPSGSFPTVAASLCGGFKTVIETIDDSLSPYNIAAE